MADQVLTKQKLINADEDLGDLEEVLNGPPGKLVKTRLGRQVYTLASVPQINTMTREEVAAAVAPKANKIDVDIALSNLSTTANKYYSTLSAANADITNIALNQSVTIGEEANSGLWEKKTAGATTLTKSAYDPLTQAKGYTSKTGFAKIAGNRQENIDYDTSNRTLTFTGTVHITTGTIRQQITTPQSVVLDQNTMYRLEFNVSTGLIRVQGYTQNYFEGWIPFAFVRVYADKIETTDFQYAINGVAFDAVKIATDTSATDSANKVKVLEDKFISKGSNLYNPAAVKVGYRVDETGVEVSDPVYSITEFIAVTPDNPLTIKVVSAFNGTPYRGFNFIGYYDANKNFIKRDHIDNTGSGSSSGAITVVVPANAYYVRLNMQDTLPANYNRQINLGSVALPYEPYKPTELKISLSQENIDQALAQTTDTAAPYIKQSSNLYNAAAASVGYRIDAEGVLVADAVYSVSDYIAIQPALQYAIKAWSTNNNAAVRGFNVISYFDSNKVFIKRDYFNNAEDATGVGVITAPTGAYYMRLNMQDTLPANYNRQINLGSVALPFEPYRVQLSGLAIGSDVMSQIATELQIDVTDNYIYDLPVDGVFNTDQIWDTYTDWRGDTKKTSDVYALFDALMAAHPDYITRQTLGQDDFGYTIYCYKFTPKRPAISGKVKIPKIFITTATHGYEHVPPLAMYLLLEQLCNNWQSDPLLEVLRFNTDILIIPVVNPSGFDDYTRKNRNGVDINRSFPQNFGWQSTDPESPYYGGEYPLSQKEAQYIVKVFDENPDVSMYYDFHNFHGTSAETRYIWVPNDGSAYGQHMAQILNSRMTRKWRSEFPWFPSSLDYFAGNSSVLTGAQAHDYARAKGIKFTSTFEVCEKWWITSDVSTYDATHCKTAVEAIANWLLINLNELKRI